MDLACIELVELVTEYLEGALTTEERARIEEHLGICDGCEAHVEQVRSVIGAAAAQPPEQLSPTAEAELVQMFRSWTAET